MKWHNRHPLIENYLRSVCVQIRAREMHKDIEQELLGHIDELMMIRKVDGYNEEDATVWAVEQMGDPAVIGQDLHRIHKPRIHWGLLGILAVLLSASLLIAYAIQLGYAQDPNRFLAFNQLALEKTVHTVLGLVLLVALYFFDYRKLRAYSWLIYGVTLVLMLFTLHFGVQHNGVKSFFLLGTISIHVMGISPYLLLAGAAGILLQVQQSSKNLTLAILYLGLLPNILFLMSPAMGSFQTYSLGFLILIYYITRRKLFTLVLAGIYAVQIAIYLFGTMNGRARIRGFLFRSEMPMADGYIYVQIDEAVRSAGWWGHGYGAYLGKLPMIHSDTVFTYIIYSLGWLSAILLTLCVAAFLVQMIHTVRRIPDRYGQTLVTSITGLFGFQFVTSIGMSLGVLPMVSIPFPLLSQSGSFTLIQLAAIGLVLSVYRRKGLHPTITG